MKRIFLPLLLFLIVSCSAAIVTAEANKEAALAAEAEERILGDIDADGLVDVKDAIALFRYSMLPQLFPVDYPGTLDLDKDSHVDISDALRLFQYSMLPEQFPIEWGNEEDAETEPTEETDFVTDDPTEAVEYIAMADLSSYTIVRSVSAENGVPCAINTLKNKLFKAVGVQLERKTDNSAAVSEYEILVGKCEREESRAFADGLRLDDYGYAVIGKKLVICGGSDEATVKAVNAFIEAVVLKLDAQSEIFFSNADAFTVRGEYELSDMTLQGIAIADYDIVYPDGDEASKVMADYFAARISALTGNILTVKSDAEPKIGKEILIGTANRTDCAAMTFAIEEGICLMGADGDYVYARGRDGMGNYYAVCALADTLAEAAAVNQNVVLEAAVTKEVPMENGILTAMSFNIYYSDMTSQRKESVKQTILNHMPDTVGVQEATTEWMKYLDTSLGGIYAHVGLGRDGGSNGEHSAIFYRRDRFELIETATKWLSDTPDVVSRYTESSLNRVMTYALLREKTTGNVILVANTHLDHTSSRARELQATVLMDILKDYAEYPIVLTGDFNTSAGSNAYRIVAEQLADSSKIAETAEEHGTYGVSVIDYAFVSDEKIDVSHYRVITEDANGMQPSDHFPLIIEYTVLP